MEYDQAKPCDYTDEQTMSIDCNVDCEYKWSNWINDMDNGTRTRNLTIIAENKNDGEPCPPMQQTQQIDVDCVGKWVDNGECEDYWKKQKYTITQQRHNAGKPCPHNEGDVKTLRPGIHTCRRKCAKYHWFWGCQRWNYIVK